MKGPPIWLSAGGKIGSPNNSKADHSKKIQQSLKNMVREQSAQ